MNTKSHSEKNIDSSKYFIWSLTGFCMGACDVVPGVSGGTMAFILGIYEKLLASINDFNGTFFRHLFTLRLKAAFDRIAWPFLCCLAVGILTAILSLSHILAWLLDNKPVLIWSFFLGLIFASVFLVMAYVREPKPHHFLWGILSGLCTYVVTGMVPVSTPETVWFLIVSGALAICAMILPGISGAFILVLLGKYHFILEAVNQRDIVTLAWVALGAGIGIITFARLLDWLLKRYHDSMMAVLTGLMVGALRKVWPWKEIQVVPTSDAQGVFELEINRFPQVFNGEVGLALGLMAIGIGLVFLLQFGAKQKRGT